MYKQDDWCHKEHVGTHTLGACFFIHNGMFSEFFIFFVLSNYIYKRAATRRPYFLLAEPQQRALLRACKAKTHCLLCPTYSQSWGWGNATHPQTGRR